METKEYYEENDEIVIDLVVLKNDIIRGIRKFWLLGLLLVIAGAAVVSVVRVALYKPMYEAKASFSISTNLNSLMMTEDDEFGFYYDKNNASLMADSFPYVLSSSIMQDVLKEDLNTDEINGEISATAIDNTNIFTITVVSDRAQDAYDIVIAIIKDYPDIAQYVIGESQTNIIQEPVMPNEPYNKVSLIKNFALGAMIGFAIWGTILMVYALTRNTIRKEENIRDRLNKHCYGTLPIVRKRDKNNGTILMELFDRRGGFRENMNSIATRIVNNLKRESDKVIVITSTLPEEGKSTFAVNLATSLGQRGKSVLLVDADLYKQNMHNYMKDAKQPLYGLVEYYEGEASVDDIIYDSKELSCHVITGQMEPQISTAAILSSTKIGNLLKVLREQYDYILIDTPPCEVLSDAAEISRYADTAIFVIRHDYAKVKHIMDAMQNLYDSKISISGCVLNGLSDGAGGYGYGKYGYGRYGYGKYGYGKYGYGGYGYGGEKK